MCTLRECHNACQSDVFHGNESSRSRSSETRAFLSMASEPTNVILTGLTTKDGKKANRRTMPVFPRWISDEIDYYVDIQGNRVIRNRVIKVFPLWNYYIEGKKRGRKNVYSLPFFDLARRSRLEENDQRWMEIALLRIDPLLFEFNCSRRSHFLPIFENKPRIIDDENFLYYSIRLKILV